VEMDCVSLWGKLCGTGLYRFCGAANFVELDCISLGGKLFRTVL
jgi:hypothetical protein